ncbi:MAG: hypothetical protein D6710_08315 [Nitrospirae bacterium]|nr:MAG: hypothetical protein D6710_08315 [Nitrospirota bacterium]
MHDELAKRYIDLKARGYKELYYVSVGGWDIIFQPLTLNEYNLILELERHMDPVLINDMVVRLAVLEILKDKDDASMDTFLDISPAIIPDKVAQAIIDASGFQSNEKIYKELVESRERAGSLESIMVTYICSVFGGLKPDDVLDMTLHEQMDLFAKAELALGNKIDERALLGQEAQNRPDIPVPPGMETTDLLSPQAADKPDWDKIQSGREVY